MSLPIATLSTSKAASDDEATGSIPASRLRAMLDAEDWRRANAALATALDPQGNGSLVAWENPQSGAKGSFVPLGQPYPSDAKICRAFRTAVARQDVIETMQGVACSEKGGDWTIAELASSKKGDMPEVGLAATSSRATSARHGA